MGQQGLACGIPTLVPSPTHVDTLAYVSTPLQTAALAAQAQEHECQHGCQLWDKWPSEEARLGHSSELGGTGEVS